MKQRLIVLPALILLISCSKSNKKAEIINAICIAENCPCFEKRKSDPVIATLELGEQVQVIDRTGKKKKAGSNRVEVKLPEGSKVWTLEENLVRDALPAAIVKNAPVFESPESANPIGDKFLLAEYAIISEQTNNWVKLTGPDKVKKGWIMKENISTQPGDVNIALLAHRNLLDKKGIIKIDKLGDFIKNIPDVDARLARELQKLLDQEVTDAIEQSIMDYEKQYYNEDIQIED